MDIIVPRSLNLEIAASDFTHGASNVGAGLDPDGSKSA